MQNFSSFLCERFCSDSINFSNPIENKNENKVDNVLRFLSLLWECLPWVHILFVQNITFWCSIELCASWVWLCVVCTGDKLRAPWWWSKGLRLVDLPTKKNISTDTQCTLCQLLCYCYYCYCRTQTYTKQRWDAFRFSYNFPHLLSLSRLIVWCRSPCVRRIGQQKGFAICFYCALLLWHSCKLSLWNFQTENEM